LPTIASFQRSVFIQVGLNNLIASSCIKALGEVSYRTVRVDDLDIFYREAGPKDGPAILLLHGLPSSSRKYQRLLESDLARQYHLIAPDYPGFGHSSWPDHKTFAYTFDHLAKVMQDFTEQLHLDRYPVHAHLAGRLVLYAGSRKDLAMIIQPPSRRRGLFLFGQFGGHSGRTGRLMRQRCEATCCPGQPARGTSALRQILRNTTRFVGAVLLPNQPGQGDIQLDLFDKNNVKSYPKWQQLFTHQAATPCSLGRLILRDVAPSRG
jgi:hypothetical protein